MTIQEPYQQYCRENSRAERGTWIDETTFKISYHNRPASELTALALIQLIPYPSRRAEGILTGEIQYTFKTEGFCYIRFKQ